METVTINPNLSDCSDADHFSYYRRPNVISAPLSDILYFSSEGRRIHLVSSANSDIFYHKLDDVEKLLQNKNYRFIRIHKSYLVNTKYVAGYDRKNLHLITGESLSISNYTYYKNLLQMFQYTDSSCSL